MDPPTPALPRSQPALGDGPTGTMLCMWVFASVKSVSGSTALAAGIFGSLLLIFEVAAVLRHRIRQSGRHLFGNLSEAWEEFVASEEKSNLLVALAVLLEIGAVIAFIVWLASA